MFAFARPPTFQSDEQFEPRPTHAVPQVDVSDDGRALTLTFSAFEITIGGNKSPAPMATQAFFFVLPFEGDANETVEIEFNVQGFVLTTEGATATVVLSINVQRPPSRIFPETLSRVILDRSSSRHPRHPSVGLASFSWSDETRKIPTLRRL